ncbi:MAG: DUF378 domain-containing protein [bacterium]|nr:DUF378 domain-containing protein [bacterium]
MKMNALDWIAMILVIIGGLNWGLWGAFEFNLVDAIFGEFTALSRIVYVIVGLSALYVLITAPMKSKSGGSAPMASTPPQQ